MDNATSLAESSAAHESYSEGDEEVRPTRKSVEATVTAAAPSRRPALQRQSSSRAKFFVCEDSEEDEDDEAAEEALFRSRIVLARSKQQNQQLSSRSHSSLKSLVKDNQDEVDGADGDNEHEEPVDEDEDEEEEEESYFSAKIPVVPSVERRRQSSSLLSDLLMAEKQQQLQLQQLTMTSSSPAPRTRTSTDMDCSHDGCLSGSPCPSATNSEGEMMVAMGQHTRSGGLARTTSFTNNLHQLQHHQQQQQANGAPSPSAMMIDEAQKAKSPLVRTKRVFKNLDGLAITTLNPVNNHNNNVNNNNTPLPSNCTVSSPSSVSVSSSPSSSSSSPLSPSRSAPNALPSTKPAANPSAGWTRASTLQVQQQVQVQIQNLVVQSTTTAHRAFRSASSTLNEVLFRAAK